MPMDIELTRKQLAFIQADCDEVLYGGAAGGGKSYGQLVDALLFALKYQGSKQLILRNTFPELQRSLILVSFTLIPKEVASYNSATHIWRFNCGSMIEFGYLETDKDVQKYQSAEYDVIRFDELTHFTEYQYTYMHSRVRGTNSFPKQIKSSTNPCGKGHAWVKARFIDPMPPNTVYTDDIGRTRIFIPAKVQENVFLMRADPGYIARLKSLPEDQQKALLDGNWDVFEGQYFTEFDRTIHVIEPFDLPKHWRRYFTLDYGLDMLAAHWIAVDTTGKCYVYREVCQPDLIISDAAKKILDTEGDDKIHMRFGPPDLWNRRQETGKSAAEIFAEHGVHLIQANNERVQGWYNVKEYLHPYTDEQGIKTANLVIFKNCVDLIKCLPQLQRDEKNPNDVATEPHDITHSPDSIRYFIAGRPAPTRKPKPEPNPLQKHKDLLAKRRSMTGRMAKRIM